jgi:hypothetical protein
MSRGLYSFLGRKAPEKAAVSYTHYADEEEEEDAAHFLGTSHPVVRGTLSAPVRTPLHETHGPGNAHCLHKRSFSVIDCAHLHAPELADASNILSEKV